VFESEEGRYVVSSDTRRSSYSILRSQLLQYQPKLIPPHRPTLRHSKSPPPNHNPIPLRPSSSPHNLRYRRRPRLLQRHPHAPHRHRRLRLRPIRRLPRSPPPLRGPQRCPQPSFPGSVLWPVLCFWRVCGSGEFGNFRSH
jgi:hypothetical protein